MAILAGLIRQQPNAIVAAGTSALADPQLFAIDARGAEGWGRFNTLIGFARML